MDRFDLLAVQGTLKSLIQHHSSKASILLCSAFFMVQLSHPYMTTGKTIALTRQTFVSKVMSLLFDMLSRLVITFLPNSNCLLISWLQSPSAVIWSPTLPWPNQTLLWTSVGLWSISLESLLIAAIISSYSCNLKPRYTSRSLHCNHQASSGMCTHTHMQTQCLCGRIPFFSGENPHPFLLWSLVLSATQNSHSVCPTPSQLWASQVALEVKNLSTKAGDIRGMWVRSLHWEYSLE